MSKAFKCDICGSLFTQDEILYRRVLIFPNKKGARLASVGLTKSYDICPCCTINIQETIDKCVINKKETKKS